ncbi:MAG TPA: GAF domain-containing sensor histidine kinase [Acidimicrobiales bacterium]|nr:GAF domain-containing sensor histidine kinase [Acidimicrobiales bacterium]
MSQGQVLGALLVAAWAGAAVALAVRGERALGSVVGGASAVAALAVAGAAASVTALAAAASCVLPAAALYVELSLPTGRLGSAARRTVVAAVAVAGAAVAVPTIRAGIVPASGAAAMAVVGALVLGAPFAHARYAAHGAVRQRLQLLGAGVAAASAVAGVAVPLGWVVGAEWPESIAIAGTVFVPMALAAGTLPRWRREAGRFLTASVTVCAVAVAVIAAHLASLLVFGRRPGADERGLVPYSILAGTLAVIAYPPVRSRLVDYVAFLARGVRRPPEEVVRTFGDRANRGGPLEELLFELATSLRHAMGLRRVEVWTRAGRRFERVVSTPDEGTEGLVLREEEIAALTRVPVAGSAWLALWVPSLAGRHQPGQVRVAPARQSGSLLGLVIAERAPEDEPFSDDDDVALTELGRRLGVVLHNRQLDATLQETLDDLRRTNEELRASRARLVAASDAERRRIERDLHDGAQQHLVALAVNLRLVHDLLGDDHDTAEKMLDQLIADVRETIQELRNLAHGIYPPLLMEGGLDPALRAAAARSPLDVEVDAGGAGRHATATEAAVYFCCLEALQNAAKHAPGSHVDIRAWTEGGELRFEVADDGPGFDPAAAHGGQGFQNMSDRIGAIGGVLTWDSAPGKGTRVRGRVPGLSPVPTGSAAGRER